MLNCKITMDGFRKKCIAVDIISQIFSRLV